MYSLLLSDEQINVSIASLVVHCRLFQTKPELLGEHYRVESRASSDSLRMFVGTVRRAVAETGDATARNGML
jgi:hypothetical protein